VSGELVTLHEETAVTCIGTNAASALLTFVGILTNSATAQHQTWRFRLVFGRLLIAKQDAVAAVGEAAAEAGRLVFGPTPVRFPVTTAVVTSYADAK
jgi:hypothetical protein